MTFMRFFRDVHPLETRENADDYIDRLDQVDDQFGCLSRTSHDSEQRGIIAPAAMLESRGGPDPRHRARHRAGSVRSTRTFADRLKEIPGLTPAERQADA